MPGALNSFEISTSNVFDVEKTVDKTLEDGDSYLSNNESLESFQINKTTSEELNRHNMRHLEIINELYQVKSQQNDNRDSIDTLHVTIEELSNKVNSIVNTTCNLQPQLTKLQNNVTDCYNSM